MKGIDCIILHTGYGSEIEDGIIKKGEKKQNIMVMPVGLLPIANLLKRNNIGVQIIHIGIEVMKKSSFDLARYIESHNTKVVAISVHWHHSSSTAIDIANNLKKCLPNIKIVIGGFTASYFALEIMQNYEVIDGVIVGDGEKPLLKYMEIIQNKKENFQDVPNLVWRDGNKIIKNKNKYTADEHDLNSLVYTDFSTLKNPEFYFKLKGKKEFDGCVGDSPQSFYVSLGRGCNVNCSYCAGCKVNQEKLFGRANPTFRDKETIIKEIKSIKSIGFSNISINNFPKLNNEDYYRDILDSIYNEGVDSSLFIESWYLPSEKIIAKLSRFKNPKFFITVDSGSERIRKINRGYYFSNFELKIFLEKCKKYKVQPVLFFATGLPYEDINELKKTIIMQKNIKRKYSSSLIVSQLVAMEPGAPWYLEPNKWGVTPYLRSFKDFYNFSKKNERKVGYRTKAFSEEEILRNSGLLLCEKGN